jgi:hypothetical protein
LIGACATVAPGWRRAGGINASIGARIKWLARAWVLPALGDVSEPGVTAATPPVVNLVAAQRVGSLFGRAVERGARR